MPKGRPDPRRQIFYADAVVDSSNAQMREYWSTAGPRWVAQQERLDAQLEPYRDAVLTRAGLRAGARVLDVGCGCGATTLGAAERVGEGGKVVAIDLSGPMLERARQRLAAAGYGDRLEVVEGDAQSYPFESGAFDVVLSRFGVMFFDDPPAAFANLARATQSGGRLAFACWQARERNPWMSVPLEGAMRHLEPPPPPEPDAPGPFTLAEPQHVRSLLLEAGFREICLEALEAPIRMAGLETAANLMMEVGPVAGLIRDQRPGPDLLEKVGGAVREALATFDTAEGVVAPAAAWAVTAEKARTMR